MAAKWQIISRRKKEEQWSRIPQEYQFSSDVKISGKNVLDVPRTCGLLSKPELEITENYDATALAEALAKNQLTSEAVTRAFCKRAAIAHQLVSHGALQTDS
jgi:amidase